MMFGVPLGAKPIVIACFAFNVGESNTLITVKSALIAAITAEATGLSLQLSDESP